MSRILARLMVGVSVAFLLTPLPQVLGQKSTRSFSSSHLKLAGFTLEVSTLADVEKKLGPSTPGGCSKEADASKMICYVSDGAEKTRVIFESGPSGGWSILDGFKVIAGKIASTCSLQCKTATALGSDAQTNGG